MESLTESDVGFAVLRPREHLRRLPADAADWQQRAARVTWTSFRSHAQHGGRAKIAQPATPLATPPPLPLPQPRTTALATKTQQRLQQQ